MKLATLAWAAMVAVALCAAPATAATVVTSAASSPFRLDTREGPFVSTGTETITYSSRWHGTSDSTVTILQNDAEIAQGLSGESNYLWRATTNGVYTLRHETTPFVLGDDEDEYEPETATFIVQGLYPLPSATLRWKYAKNANGWYCAQVALKWHPGYANGLANLRLLFEDRHDDFDRLAAHLVDPATAVEPLGETEVYRDVEYRVAKIDLSAFASLGENDRAVFGVSDATMDSSLDSVPSSERKICLRVSNRQIQTLEVVENMIAWLAWDDGDESLFLPLLGNWTSAQTARTSTQHAVSRPLSVDEANLSESFGLPLAAVAVAEVTCRIASMSFGEDGCVEGTFEVAAEDAGVVVAEGGELSTGARLVVLGATGLGATFEPLDPAAFGVELISRKPPYAFRVKTPGDKTFFKVQLEAEERYE